MKKTYFEEFGGGTGKAANMEELSKKKAAAIEESKNITLYLDFVEQAQDLDEDDIKRNKIADKMKDAHDAECKKLFKEDGKEEIGAHIEAYKAAKKTILKPSKNKPTRSFKATNVYDDDDNPTNQEFKI